MPGNLHVRNVDDELILRLKRRASRHGRSAEAEHREILRQALEPEVEQEIGGLLAQIRALSAGRPQTPSEVLQRESRDER
jgi:plasmid stability protein